MKSNIRASKNKKRNKIPSQDDVIKDKDGKYNIPQFNISEVSRPLTDSELSIVSETTCLRPDIFLNNGRHCDGCKYFKVCRSRLKTLPKHIVFINDEFVSTEIRKSNKK